MRAIELRARDGVDKLEFVEDAPKPVPGRGEVLVRVYATSVSPTELGWYSSMNWSNEDGTPRAFPIVPGHDFSGVVAEIGEGVEGINTGEAKYGLLSFYRNGAEADYVIALPREIAPKPRSLGHLEAAAVPLSGLTAWQALFDHANLTSGQSILILGASGGVGSFAVQFASWSGAEVIAATSKQNNREFLLNLGAKEVTGYSSFQHFSKKVDVVLDLVGGDVQNSSWSTIRAGGIFVSTVGGPLPQEKAAAAGAKGLFFIVTPNGKELAKIAELIDSGKVVSQIQKVLPLKDAKAAFEEGLSGHNRGKTVLQVSS
ncbi:MAG: NADP-dependent oxidoreductase [Thaumarchaeota archaeon]|nr:NADP-dependent oxidoreductase [Nitrososphaerota archaeon]